ncbi:thiopurine S-methyltransferase [Methylomonas sp. MgM2]
MQHEFWHQRWRQNQIGFHQPEVNPYLQRHWPNMMINPASRVLVPLCGKSKDMFWLLSMGYQVLGVELSPVAAESFFSENGLTPITYRRGDFSVYEVDGLRIFCGDFFALRANLIGKIDAVYDRASLVALPPEMRLEYVWSLSTLVSPTALILLIAFDYPQHEMQGPPFSVANQEVEQLFGNWCDIDLLSSDNILEQAHFKGRGLTRMTEQAYRLVVR